MDGDGDEPMPTGEDDGKGKKRLIIPPIIWKYNCL